LGGGAGGLGEGEMVTLAVDSLETRRHRLVRRPQCPCCGDPGRWSRAAEPIRLRSQMKRFTADGGHRVVSPERTLARYGHHVSPITGAVSNLEPVPLDDDGLLHVYFAGHNLSSPADNLHALRRGLRSNSSGKGVKDNQARASGLCEALERYSGVFRGNEMRTRATYRSLGDIAIHPNACMLFSATQYQHAATWNRSGSPFKRVPEPFDEEASVDWTPVWSLTHQTHRYLPTAYCYYNALAQPDARYCWGDSNGSAAGNTVEEAILQGFFELVERDSVGLWWYNLAKRPAVDLDSFDEPYVAGMIDNYQKRHRAVWVLDITGDLGIPAFTAISRRIDQQPEHMLFGFGAHFDARIALLRALTEMNQNLAFDIDPGQATTEDDREAEMWLRNATIANQAHLAPDDAVRPRRRDDFAAQSSEDVREDVLCCQALVEQLGLEMLVLDQTRPDVELPVAKVFVPGMRHLWARFAPGRLYDVPVKLGWLGAKRTEDQLNPITMSF
ncbi:MAG: TOMM precursor leader peptide-binding protein, partial [Candidatus Dormibacteraeota bacterium]|nr:TOMM precursor leader peptide-binding protein [Candidatus Dormibacteraeota bacterium]